MGGYEMSRKMPSPEDGAETKEEERALVCWDATQQGRKALA